MAKTTVALSKGLKPVFPGCGYALVTPSELGRHLGVSRQRASALLHRRRVLGHPFLPRDASGRWYVAFPVRLRPGSRGPVLRLGGGT